VSRSTFLRSLLFSRANVFSSLLTADGTFRLLSFLHTPPRTSPALSLALLPFSLTSSVTLGSSGGAFSLTLTSRAPPSRPLTNLEIRIPLGSGANGLTAQVSGGAFKRDDQGRSVGGGAGRWEVETKHEAGGGGEGRQTLVWKIDELISTDRPALLLGQYYA
jgi:AP-3 complex subunit mu